MCDGLAKFEVPNTSVGWIIRIEFDLCLELLFQRSFVWATSASLRLDCTLQNKKEKCNCLASHVTLALILHFYFAFQSRFVLISKFIFSLLSSDAAAAATETFLSIFIIAFHCNKEPLHHYDDVSIRIFWYFYKFETIPHECIRLDFQWMKWFKCEETINVLR